MSERIAINYAKEIYRKRIAVEKTKSDTLKRDYWKNIKESRKELKDAACDLYEKHAPQIAEAKKQALESVDLMKYKLERQFRKLNNSVKSKKMQKAKELEDIESNNSDNEFDY